MSNRFSLFALATVAALTTMSLAAAPASAFGGHGGGSHGGGHFGGGHFGGGHFNSHFGSHVFYRPFGHFNQRFGGYRPMHYFPRWSRYSPFHWRFTHYRQPYGYGGYGGGYSGGYGRGNGGGGGADYSAQMRNMGSAPVSGPAPVNVASAPQSGNSNCLTKQQLPDGTVLFQDICTHEEATTAQAEASPQPQGGPQQAR